MPFNLDKINLTPKYDRRVKLTPEDKEQIRRLYAQGGFSMRQLAGKFQVSKRLIQFVIYPERLAKLHAQVKLEKRWLKYYDREKHNNSVKSLRRYKRELINTNQIAAGK